MSGIFWLASYPKSGNTWFRVFLSNYLRDAGQAVSINDLGGWPIASDQAWFDDQVGALSTELLPDEIDALRPALYEALATAHPEPLHLKIHDLCRQLPDGRWLVSEQVTRGAVYLVRNPLDVAVSYAHHRGISPSACVDSLNRPEVSRTMWHLGKQLPHQLGSWSEHVRSWLDQTVFPVLLLRYEDMLAHPEACFGRALEFLQLPHDPARLQRALQFSSLDELQRQEQRDGFIERQPMASAPFFRSGRAGGWRDALSATDVERVIQAHGALMRRLGYLHPDGSPV